MWRRSAGSDSLCHSPSSRGAKRRGDPGGRGAPDLGAGHGVALICPEAGGCRSARSALYELWIATSPFGLLAMTAPAFDEPDDLPLRRAPCHPASSLEATGR